LFNLSFFLKKKTKLEASNLLSKWTIRFVFICSNTLSGMPAKINKTTTCGESDDKYNNAEKRQSESIVFGA